MRRMDLDMVNATAMFNATYPSVSEAMEATENSYLASKYEADGAIVEKASSGALAGVWVTISQAQELAKEYGIDLFMQPLLDAPARRSTTKVASAPTPATETATVVGTISTSEPQEKDEVQTTTSETIIVATTETVFVKEEIEAIETEIVSQGTKESEEEKDGEKAEEEVEEKNEEKDEEKDEEAPVEKATVMKRRIEELEDQATRDRKRYRGLITVAVGLVAAAALPQVLPYFS
ncbi:hypothetical protein BC939DRAFT_55788 [Gamsiella multidivaricata]|uniref:uncharacterized protein n=1 Tax=Gamsiella multidivaricata TaxID=101098 RepID=UPI0022205824|nr:uncharacterized protein BC939DRAFT_55788 [Gamsiella multidivaricata]KAI7816229.1 hypothetical protein BC939DRAFT_55788 [Gamsiella multidivaricata]